MDITASKQRHLFSKALSALCEQMPMSLEITAVNVISCVSKQVQHFLSEPVCDNQVISAILLSLVHVSLFAGTPSCVELTPVLAADFPG